MKVQMVQQICNTREDAGLTVNLESKRLMTTVSYFEVRTLYFVPISAGQQEGVQIFNIVAEVRSGRIRLRDRQTLILTGVIQESDRRLAQKWPILGITVGGQMFRSSNSTRPKNELVVGDSSILNDDNGFYGYAYQPSTSAGRELLQSGF